MSKPEREFFRVDDVPLTRCAGQVSGLSERLLTGVGAVPGSRILRFDPSTDTTPNGVQVHDFWEEVYILEGSIVDLTLDQTFTSGMYACRPPGMPHGPWISDEGCLTFEVRYRGAEASE